MEKCTPISGASKDKLSALKQRLNFCVRLLHRFHIVHKDIKPENVMYSSALGDFVLVDFGLSEYLANEPGYLSLTYREGTPKYMSPEMLALNKSTVGLVDLYYNDLHSLMLTLTAALGRTWEKSRRAKGNNIQGPHSRSTCSAHKVVSMASVVYNGSSRKDYTR